MAFAVFDTDILTLLMQGNAEVCRRVAQSQELEIATTIISVEEGLTGWYSKVRHARTDASLIQAYASLQQTAEAISVMRILPLDAAALAIARGLRTKHRRLGVNDLRIAAIVLHRSGILVTRNRSDFAQIEGLQIDDWSIPTNRSAN